MNIKTVTYMKIYPTGMNYLNHRIGVEVEVAPGESPEDAFKLAKDTVDRWNAESNPGMATAMEYMNGNGLPVIKTNDESKKSASERIIDQINGCSDIKVLETFKLLAKNHPEVQEAYDKKLKSFQ